MSEYSDNEGYKSCRCRDKRRDDSYSDYDSDYERRKDKKKKSKKNKKKGKQRGPTNIDDFDEVDYASDSSYTSSTSSSDSSSESDASDSDSEKVKKALEITNAAWALTGTADAEKMSERIKSQQAKIKNELASLSQLQKETGNKTLSPELQKMLQQDLQKLEQLQTMLKENQGNQSLQTQLLGQQMLLFEHLTEAKESIDTKEKEDEKPKEKPKEKPASPSPTGLTADTKTPANYQLQMIQQQALHAEHQMQALAAEQHMQALAAEQQRQMLMAAEQQRMAQIAQMATMQTPFMSPQQSPYGHGMSPMSPMYNPYANSVGYF